LTLSRERRSGQSPAPMPFRAPIKLVHDLLRQHGAEEVEEKTLRCDDGLGE
jgi:hypothetical protein